MRDGCSAIIFVKHVKTVFIQLRKLLVKFSLAIYFLCKIVLIYQECGDSACRSHNEITRQWGQINTIGVGLLRTRNSGKFYTVCVIILHRVFLVKFCHSTQSSADPLMLRCVSSHSTNNANLDKTNFDIFCKIDCCAAIHG